GGEVLGDHPLRTHTEQPAALIESGAGDVRGRYHDGGGGNAGKSSARQIDAVVGVHPGSTALDVDQATLEHHCAHAARHRSQPIALGGAVQDDEAVVTALDVHSSDIALHAEDEQARLPVKSGLTATQEAAAAILVEGKSGSQRDGDRPEVDTGEVGFV